MMMRNKIAGSLLVASLALGLAGCQNKLSPDTYTPGTLQQVNKVDRAVVQRVRLVEVKGTAGSGALLGAAAGGVAGSQIGRGGGNALATVAGVLIAGAIAASA